MVTRTDRRTSRWFLPGFCLALGLIVFVAAWAGGDRGLAVTVVVAMGAIAAVLAFGGRSDLIRQIRGDGGDERSRLIDQTAATLAGYVLLTALIALWLVELARGRDGSPYGQLMALSGAAYVIAYVALRLRR